MQEQIYPVTRQIGRIVVRGANVRVEWFNRETGQYELIGYYESLSVSHPDSYDERRKRKVEEIESVFEQWVNRWEELGKPDNISVVWRDSRTLGSDLSRFLPLDDEEQSGCSVVRLGDQTIALIYKKKSSTKSVWAEPEERRSRNNL